MTRYNLIFALSIAVFAVGLLRSETAVTRKGESDTEEEPLPGMSENAPLEINIWGGIRDLYKIAVPELFGPEKQAREAQLVMMSDLKLSSLFDVIEPKSYLADNAAEGMTIDKDPWLQVGAQGVNKCKVTLSGEQLKMACKLFEVARPKRAVLSESYTGSISDIRGVVHRWVNKVIGYYTGRDGTFGTKLAFARRLGPGVKHIFTADWSGGGLSKVTRNNSINLLPAFGPGGSVYYTSFVEGAPFLYRTGQRSPVLRHPGLNMGAAFHGNKMAVVLSKDGNPEIYVGNANGSGLKRLTNSGSIDVSPTWSPDGKQIAFVSDRHGTPQVFVMNAGGGAAKRLTFKGSYNQTPYWCQVPGSNLIAFTGRDGGTYDIFTVDAKSGQIRRLTQKQGRNMDPAFSPDCRSVAFHSSRGGIFVSNPEGLNQNLVIKGAADTIKWSR